MAIFVTNPTSSAIPTVSTDAQDPSSGAADAGFTEELAAAMQPSEAVAQPAANGPSDKHDTADNKLTDLQILPAEVLFNAVGDANFALAGQAGASNSVAQNASTALASSDATETSQPAEDATGPNLLQQLQGQELAAANLAAQMSASAANLSGPVTNKAAEVSTTASIDAKSSIAQEAVSGLQTLVTSITPLAPASNTPSVSTESFNLVNATQLQLRQQAEDNSALDSQVTVNGASQATPALTSATQAQLSNTVAVTNPSATAAQVQGYGSQQENLTNQPNAAQPSSVQTHATAQAASAVTNDVAVEEVAASIAEGSASTSSNLTDSRSIQTDAMPSVSLDKASPTSSLVSANSVTLNTSIAADTKVEVRAVQGQESAFNFDAKLSKSDASHIASSKENSTSLPGFAKALEDGQSPSLATKAVELGAPTNAVSDPQNLTGPKVRANVSMPGAGIATTPEIETYGTTFSPAQAGGKTVQSSEASIATANSPAASTASTSRLDSTALANANASSAVAAQEAPRAEIPQSLEDISSSFVSSLVGGPQRPVNTVMDWISMQSQERPAPLVPHEVRLDAGSVQSEIQKMVKQGGGHVVMELTPPDQSKFTIELKLDDRGGALLIVDGVSDSTKTRLEQSAPQLREQFQQMGLELQLDMRQQGQSASSNAPDFSGTQDRSSAANNLASKASGDTPKLLTPREAGALRARETGANQVFLYA